jgi:hypothetical protein
MMKEINTMMDEIDGLRAVNPKAAYKEFRTALHDVEPHVKNVRKLFLKYDLLFNGK